MLREVCRNYTYGVQKARGCRTNYIPDLTDEFKTLYEAYLEQYRCNPLGDGTIDDGNKLIELMVEQKKERWEEMIILIDLTDNSVEDNQKHL